MPHDPIAPSESLREEIKRLMNDEIAQKRGAINSKVLDNLRASDWGREYLAIRFPQYVEPINNGAEDLLATWIDADLCHMADLLTDIERRGRPDKFKVIYQRIEKGNPEKVCDFLDVLSRSRYYYLLSRYHKEQVKYKLDKWKKCNEKVGKSKKTLLMELKELLSEEDHTRLSKILSLPDSLPDTFQQALPPSGGASHFVLDKWPIL